MQVATGFSGGAGLSGGGCRPHGPHLLERHCATGLRHHLVCGCAATPAHRRLPRRLATLELHCCEHATSHACMLLSRGRCHVPRKSAHHLHAGNAVERPDGSVGLLMRMPRMQLDGLYFIDLNHACLLSLQPSAHFGLHAERASATSAGVNMDNPPAGSAPNSSVMTANGRQPVEHEALPAAAMRRQLRATAAEGPGRPGVRSSHASSAAAEARPSDIHHGSRIRQQQLRQRGDVALEAGTLAFERVVVSSCDAIAQTHACRGLGQAAPASCMAQTCDPSTSTQCPVPCRTCQAVATSSWCARTA